MLFAVDHCALKQYPLALNDANQLICKFPNDHENMVRAYVYLTMGEYEKCIADATIGIRDEPQRPGPYSNRAMAYEKLGQLKNALADL